MPANTGSASTITPTTTATAPSSQANAPGPGSILHTSRSNPQLNAPGQDSASVVPPSFPHPASSQPSILQTRPVLDTTFSRPALGTVPLPASPPTARVISYDEKAIVHPSSSTGHGYAPMRAPDDGEVDPHTGLRRKVTPLPRLPSRGSPVIQGSVDDEYRNSVAQPDLGRMNTMNSHRGSNIDWIVPPSKDVAFRPKTVGERLDPTLHNAYESKTKYAAKARITGFALNIAIGLQVLLGALTTGLAATSHSGTPISVLGGLATLVASFLARARGSNEPELSITRVKDLEQFIRECEAFKMDVGHETGHEHDAILIKLRDRFEELLGNANGERKLSPPV